MVILKVNSWECFVFNSLSFLIKCMYVCPLLVAVKVCNRNMNFGVRWGSRSGLGFGEKVP